jgi:hypothetical protein
MEDKDIISCDVISDLMVLYTTDMTSAATRELVDTHLQSCVACTQAFRYEPKIPRQLVLPKGPKAPDFENKIEFGTYWLLQIWSGILFGLSQILELLGRVLRKFGISTAALKIRMFRARRKIAGVLVCEDAREAV